MKAPLVALICLAMWSGHCAAGDAYIGNDGAIIWQAGVDGVEVHWNKDGSVRRISAKHFASVEQSDQRGIAKGRAIAEQKARAAIVRFMKQSASSASAVTEVQSDLNDLNRAMLPLQTGADPIVKKINESTLVEALTRVTALFASGKLSGLTVLDKGDDSGGA